MVHGISRFKGAQSKIERAIHHIQDLNAELGRFATGDGDVCDVLVEQRSHPPRQYVVVEITKPYPQHLALIIGDAIHNLRSALDIGWFRCVEILDEATAATDTTIKFPIFKEQKTFEDRIAGRIKKTPRVAPIYEWAKTVKPYEAGNYALWGLDDLDARDKHQLIIPVFDLITIEDVYLQNDVGEHTILWLQVPRDGGKVMVDDLLSGDIRVKHYGSPSANVIFGIDFPFAGRSVIPTLDALVEEVRSTLVALELFLFGNLLD